MKRLLFSCVTIIIAFAGLFAEETSGSYQIVFKSDPGGRTELKTNTALSRFITEGAEYIEAVSSLSGCYYETKYGLQLVLSSSLSTAKFSLSDAGKINATKIIVETANGKNNSYLNINGTNQQIIEDTPTEYTYELDGSELTEISMIVSGNIYVSSITVCYGNEPETPGKITPELKWSANEAQAYLGKAFNAPVLSVAPEGHKDEIIANVKYSSSDEGIAMIDQDGAVKILSAGTVSITASIEANEIYEAASATYTLVVIDGSTTSYQIIFNSEEGRMEMNVYMKPSRFLDSGTEYIDGISSLSNCAYGIEYGLQIYSSGHITLRLTDAGKVNATKIVAQAAYGKTNNTLDINGKSQPITSDTPADYTYELNGSELTEIKLTAKENVYIASLTVYYEAPTIEPDVINSIAETKQLADETLFNVGYDLTVAYVADNNIYAMDAAGDFIQIVGENNYNVNDIIPAGWNGNYTLQNGTTPEITPADALPESTETTTFIAKTVDATMITSEMVNSVISINNVVFEEDTPETKDLFAGMAGDIMMTFCNQYDLASMTAGTYNLNVVVAMQQKAVVLNIIAFKPVVNIRINGESVTDDILDTNGEMATLSIDVPDGYEVWYRFTPDTQTAKMLADDSNDGFIKYTEPVSFTEPGKLEYYILETATGNRSETSSLKLDGVTGINEIISDGESGNTTYYNLQGVRVDNPTKGVYIRVQGSKAIKVKI